MATDKNWFERHEQQTSRLSELVMPAIAANRNNLNKIMDAAEVLKPAAKISTRIKMLHERLKNRGDFGVYNACLEIASLYLALKDSEKFAQFAAQVLPVLDAIREKIGEYCNEAGIDKNYSADDYAQEKLDAKKQYGSDMIGIEHLWAKSIIEILERMKDEG